MTDSDKFLLGIKICLFLLVLFIVLTIRHRQRLKALFVAGNRATAKLLDVRRIGAGARGVGGAVISYEFTDAGAATITKQKLRLYDISSPWVMRSFHTFTIKEPEFHAGNTLTVVYDPRHPSTTYPEPYLKDMISGYYVLFALIDVTCKWLISILIVVFILRSLP